MSLPENRIPDFTDAKGFGSLAACFYSFSEDRIISPGVAVGCSLLPSAAVVASFCFLLQSDCCLSADAVPENAIEDASSENAVRAGRPGLAVRLPVCPLLTPLSRARLTSEETLRMLKTYSLMTHGLGAGPTVLDGRPLRLGEIADEAGGRLFDEAEAKTVKAVLDAVRDGTEGEGGTEGERLLEASLGLLSGIVAKISRRIG